MRPAIAKRGVIRMMSLGGRPWVRDFRALVRRVAVM